MTEFNVTFNEKQRLTDVRIDDFREMVNYDNTKNKGYVRMALGTDGKVVLQKVNNKVDCWLKLRFNMGAENNANLRQLFLKSMEGDCKYMSDFQRNEIKKLILKGQDVKAENVSGKALSRVDVREIFAKFDEQFNTASGRRGMYHHFLDQVRSMLNLPQTVDDKELETKYLKLDELGLGDIHEFLAVKEGDIKQKVTDGGTDRINKHEQMVKTEADFRAFLFALEGRLGMAEKLVSLERQMRHIATESLSQNRTGDLTENEKDKLRTCLTSISKLYNFDSLDVIDGDKLGTKLSLTQVFIDHVVPAMMHRKLEDINAVGVKQQQEAIDANFDMDELRLLYEEFIKGAHTAANKTEESHMPDMVNELSKGLDNGIGVSMASQSRVEVMKRVAVTSKQAFQLGNNMVGLMSIFDKNAKVNAFANAFIKDKFPEMELKLEKLPENKVELAIEYTDTLITAAQIQFGARVKKGETYYNQSSANKYLQTMFQQVLPTVCNKLGGGLPLYNLLMKHTIPTMMNHLIREAATKPELKTAVIFNTDQQPLETLGAAFLKFQTGTQKKMISVAIRGFDKLIDSLVKKNKLGNGEGVLQEANDLKNRLSERLNSISQRIAARYFSQDPGNKTEEDFAHELNQLFIEERNAIMDDFNTELNALVLSNIPVNRQAKELAKTRDNVNAFLQDNPDIMKEQGESIRPTLERMYNQRLCNSLKDAKIKNYELPKDFTTKFLSSYADDVKKLLKNYNTFSSKLNSAFMKTLQDGFYDGIESNADNPDSIMGRYKDLPKKDLKAFEQSFVNDMFHGMQDKLQSLRERYLANPEAMEKEDIDDLISREFYADNSTSGLNGAFQSVVMKREINLTDWIGNYGIRAAKKNSKGEVLVPEEDTTQKFKGVMWDWAKTTLDDEASNDGTEMLTDIERSHLALQAAFDKYGQVAKYSLMYGSVDKTEANQKAFQQRVQSELSTEVRTTAKNYSAFKAEFLKLTIGDPKANYTDKDNKELQDLFGKKLGQYTALTTEYLVELFDKKMYRFSQDFGKVHLDAKTEAKAFLQELQKTQDKIVAEQQKAALKRQMELTRIYQAVADKYDEELKAGSEKLRQSGASEQDIAYYENTLVPTLKNKLQLDINNNPKSYENEERAIDNATFLASNHIDLMVQYFKDYDINTDDGMQRLVNQTFLGLKRFMTSDETTKRIVFDAVRTWIKLPENQELYKNARVAHMGDAIFDSNMLTKAKQEADKMLDAMGDNLREALLGYLTQEKLSSLNKNDMPLAKELFGTWLSQYNLPKTPLGRSNGENMTISDMAMEMFYNRTKEVMSLLAQDPSAKVQLLDAKFMKEFLNLLNTHGLEVMLYEVGQKFVADRTDALFSKEFYQTYFYNPADNDGFTQADASENVKAAMIVNYMNLTETLNNNVKRAVQAAQQQFTSVEDLTRWEDSVGKLYRTYGAVNTNSLRFSSENRVTQIKQLEAMDQDYVVNLVNEAMSEFFKVDINRFDFSSKMIEKYGSPTQLRNTLCQQAWEKFPEIKGNLIKTALDNREKASGYFRVNNGSNRALDGQLKEEFIAIMKGYSSKSTQELIKQMLKEGEAQKRAQG